MNAIRHAWGGHRPFWAFAALAVLLGLPSGYCSATTTTYGFVAITSNSTATNLAAVTPQLLVDVTDATPGLGANQVDFVFRNTGPVASSITGIYFDDGALLSIASVIDGPGTNFEQGGAPPGLPGGNNANPDFETSAGFLATTESGVNDGVQPGESVTVRFNLKPGMTYAHVITALSNGLILDPSKDADDLTQPQPNLRIGIHVQQIAGLNSDSFINGPPNTVAPEPSTLVLALTGIAGLGYTGLRRMRRRYAPTA